MKFSRVDVIEAGETTCEKCKYLDRLSGGWYCDCYGVFLIRTDMASGIAIRSPECMDEFRPVEGEKGKPNER